MTRRSRSERDDRDEPDADEQTSGAGSLPNGSTRFALLSEVLLVGAVVGLLSLPVVTLVPALAVGVRHLRRHLAGEADSVRLLVRDMPAALRDLWPVGVLLPIIATLLAFNVWTSGAGSAPGGQVVGPVSAIVGAAVVVVALRTAGTWQPGLRWWPGVRAAARRSRGDLTGSALLLSAVVMCVVLVWMLAPLVIVVGGLLAFAELAVEHRLTNESRGTT